METLSGWIISPGLRLARVPLTTLGALLIGHQNRGLYSARTNTFPTAAAGRYSSLAEATMAVESGTVPDDPPADQPMLRFLRQPSPRAVLLAQNQCIPYNAKVLDRPADTDLDDDKDLPESLQPVQAFLDDAFDATYGQGSSKAANGSGNLQTLITIGLVLGLAAAAAVFLAEGIRG